MALSRYLVYCIHKFEGAVTKDHKMITTRRVKKVDESQIHSDAANVCWESVATQMDEVNIIVKKWSGIFAMIIDKHAPTMQMRITEKY